MTAAGFLDAPHHMYYEWVLPGGGQDGPALLMIHGGGLTGTCFRVTPDGRRGWADHFAARGFRVLVTDWPGTGRSGDVSLDRLDYAFLVEAFAALARQVDGQLVILAQSMGAPIAWKLLETMPDRVRLVVGAAPAPPGNIQPSLAVDGSGVEEPVEVTVRGVRLRIDRDRPTSAVEYIERVAIGTSARFPGGDWRAFTTGFPPRVLLERLNAGGAPSLDPAADLRGSRTVIVTGTDDANHSRADDEAIATFLASRGAEVEYLWLGDHGVHGNGHMLMWEDNSLEIADLIADRVLASIGGNVSEAAPRALGDMLLGTWRLRSLTRTRTDDGRREQPLGEQPDGRLTYGADGRVSVHLVAGNRAALSHDDSRGATDAERAAAFTTYIGYAGTFEIQDGAVVHHVEVASNPNHARTQKLRFVEVSEHELVLRSPATPIVDGTAVIEVRWTRVTSE